MRPSPEPLELWRALLEASLDAVLVLDFAGTVGRASAPAERLWAVGESALVGRPLLELVCVEARPVVARALARRDVEGRVLCRATPLLRADGRETIADLSLVPTAGGGAVVVVSDVTERERLERRARESDRLVTVGTLVAGIAHEINNPAAYVLTNLACLRGYQDRLHAAFETLCEARERDPSDRAARRELRRELDLVLSEFGELVHESIAGGEHIRGILGDLKSFSRPSEARQRDVSVELELEAAVRLARGDLRYRASVRRSYQPNLPPVFGNAIRLSQLFLNLVLNAVQAMDHERQAMNVLTLATSLDGEGVRVDISDTGCGIEPEVLPHIFESFFTTKPEGEGTGLGLAICKEIAAAHGGEIRVQSTPGQGTTFSVWLPLRREIAQVVPPPAPSLSSEGHAPPVAGIGITSRSPAPSSARLRVLIVDDELRLLTAYRRMFSSRYEVLTASGGRAACELVASGAPVDVVVSDMMMPDLDGAGLYDEIARLRPGLERRMIFVTAGNGSERVRSFFARVPNPRFDKPADLDQLQASINRLCTTEA